jgi:SpoVK/Ycf46/Vps4 family AAA+-type ATPase
MIKKLMKSENHVLSSDDLEKIASLSDGYSGADMKSLCQEASLGPIRLMTFDMINNIQADQVNLSLFHFRTNFHNFIPVFRYVQSI